MSGKILIKSELKVLTGLHIGGSEAFSAIGAIDSPVIKDKRTNLPIVPGSSLKGKLRTLLQRSITKDIEIMRNHNEDDIVVKRLFGTSNPIIKSRLQFADAFLKNVSDFNGLSDITEAKFENTINRINCVATPRQIERVVSGAVFEVNITYSLNKESEFVEDMKNLSKAMKLLQLDYLGGHGTRGSGRISFQKIEIKGFECNLDLNSINPLFKEVEDYELLSI